MNVLNKALLMTVALASGLTWALAGTSAGQGRGGGGFTQPDPIAFDNHEGWISIFDGTSLKNWEGNPDIWRLENGAITGTSTPEKPSGTTYIIWEGGKPGNFELKAEMKLEGSGLNSGIQYRSTITPGLGGGAFPGLKGYQADFDFAGRYTGQLYERFRSETCG